jgi:hypothetical protein
LADQFVFSVGNGKTGDVKTGSGSRSTDRDLAGFNSKREQYSVEGDYGAGNTEGISFTDT